jgi:hypothetical protein
MWTLLAAGMDVILNGGGMITSNACEAGRVELSARQP